ncbi:MAG: hypothetical protein FWG88_02325 [Oscillospiraceae bacterium]|nr:hypothetical protein [Oscillospiraceae bacterium]
MAENNAARPADAPRPAPPPPQNLPTIDYPIPPRENMKLLLEQKKPLWVPIFMMENNFCLAAPADRERPPVPQSGLDWFGTYWEYVQMVGGQMSPPEGRICPDPRDWREKLIFPDLDAIDFSEGKEEMAARFAPEKMTMYVIQNGMFERLLDISDVNEVFIWLAEDPDDAIEYANAMADFKIKHIDKVIDEWGLVDFFALSDDWGTQKAPFISPTMWEQIFYGPTKRIADHIHSRGYYVNVHSCGKIEQLVPYIATFSDLWEGQRMNDHAALKKVVGNELAFTIGLDSSVLMNPDVSDDEVIKAVRDCIDTYGEGGGMVMTSSRGATERISTLLITETFEYSRKKYAGN